MDSILAFIDDFYTAYRRTPSTAEIGKQFNVVKSTAYKYLTEMNARGMLQYRNGEVHTKLMDRLNDVTMVPFFSKAVSPAAQADPAAAADALVLLPSFIFGDGRKFVVRAQDESTIDAGIAPGDYVVVESAQAAEPGSVIAAQIGSYIPPTTLRVDHETGKYYLHPEDGAAADIQLDDPSILGIVSYVIKHVAVLKENE